jgi:hypothetical protein
VLKLPLRRAAGIRLIDQRRPHTAAALIRTNTVREIIVIRAQLARTVVTHPVASRSRPHRERHAAVGRTSTHWLEINAVVVRVRRVAADKAD